jgi:hypothetical protein
VTKSGQIDYKGSRLMIVLNKSHIVRCTLLLAMVIDLIVQASTE